MYYYHDYGSMMYINFVFLAAYTLASVYTLAKHKLSLDRSAYWTIAGGELNFLLTALLGLLSYLKNSSRSNDEERERSIEWLITLAEMSAAICSYINAVIPAIFLYQIKALNIFLSSQSKREYEKSIRF